MSRHKQKRRQKPKRDKCQPKLRSRARGDGMTVWWLGDRATVAPTLRADAPGWVWANMCDLVLGVLTGTCPRCGHTISLGPLHEEGCAVADDARYEPWFVKPRTRHGWGGEGMTGTDMLG